MALDLGAALSARTELHHGFAQIAIIWISARLPRALPCRKALPCKVELIRQYGRSGCGSLTLAARAASILCFIW